jgi:hypothetical protein
LARRPNFTNQANPAAQQMAAAQSAAVAVGNRKAKAKKPKLIPANPKVIHPINRFMANSFFFYYIKTEISAQAPNFHITFILPPCYFLRFLL